MGAKRKTNKRLKTGRFGLGALWAVATGVVVLGGLAGVFWRMHPRASTYDGPVEHISTGLIDEYASLIFIAQHEGYFKANGLDVATTQFSSGPEALSALFAGKVDTAMASDFAGVSNSFHNEDIRILATVCTSETFFMVGHTGQHIATPADLKGKTIGITHKTVGEFYLGQYLTFNNLSFNDVHTIDLPQAGLIDALAAGKIDAAVLFEPNAYRAKQRLNNQAFSWSVQSGQNIYSLLYGGGRIIREHPEALKRYMQALAKAEDFVRNHNAQARQIIAQRLHYSHDYINYIWPRFTFALSLDQELLLNMDDEARWAIENRLTDTAHPPDYLHLIYFDALQAAEPEAITIIR